MRSARGIAPLVLAVAMATGCTDTTRPEASVNEGAIAPPQTSAHYTAYGPQTPPPGVSSEWLVATDITVEAAAGFRSEPTNPDEGVIGNARSYAWGQSLVRYWGNEADAAVDVIGRKGGTQVAAAHADQNDRHFFPASRSFSAITQAPVASGCGHVAQANASGRAWNRVILFPLGWFTWGEKGDTKTAYGYQDQCESGSPPSSGGGSVTEPDSPGGKCLWHRDFIVFADGSWRWLTSWYKSCGDEYELGVAHDGPTDIANGIASLSGAKNASSAPMKLTIVGVAGTGSGQITTIERSGKANTDATIVIDLARATAADLEEAFVSAEALTLKVKPKDAGAYGQVNGSPSEAARVAAVEGSRAATHLKALLAAADGHGKSGNPTSIDVIVHRKQ